MKTKLKNEGLRQRITKAIMELINQVPCLSGVFMSQEFVEDDTIPFPLKTNGKTIWYNPDAIENWELNDIKFGILHESMHFVQKSPIRIKQYCGVGSQNVWNSDSALLYNVASDLAINTILYRDKWRMGAISVCLPGCSPFEDFPRGKDTEFYFDLLMEKKREQDKQKEQEKDEQDNPEDDGKDNDKEEESGGKGSKNDEGEETPDGDNDDSEGEDEDGEEEGTGEDSDEDGEGSGSGDDGEESDEDDSDGGKGRGHSDESVDEGSDRSEVPQGCGTAENVSELSLEELLDNPKVYPADIQPGEQELTEGDMSATLAMSASYGVGGHIDSCIRMAVSKELEPPKIPWQRQLRLFLNKKEHAKPSYTRPNRRRFDKHVVFPSRSNHTLGDAALLCDSSGSMIHCLDPVACEAHSLISVFPKSKFWIIIGDTCVRKVQEMGQGKPVIEPTEWCFPGLGGTFLNPLFSEAIEKRVSIIICMTDLGFSSFPPRPDVPVIWVVPERYLESAKRVPYGAVILMDDKPYMARFREKYQELAAKMKQQRKGI